MRLSEDPSNPKPNPSFRNLVCRSLHSHKDLKDKSILIAEDVKDWPSLYGSLSDFMLDIASMCSLVIVISETHSSTAELGMFYNNEIFREKIITIVSEKHFHEPSFIKFGILDPLIEENEDSVLSYKVAIDKPEGLTEDDARSVADDVAKIIESFDKTVLFKSDRSEHLTALIYQLVHLFSAVTAKELDDYVALLLRPIGRKKVKQILYTLEEFGFLTQSRTSNQTYYFPAITSGMFMDFKFSGPKKTDYVERKISLLSGYVKNNNHRLRVRAIRGRDGS